MSEDARPASKVARVIAEYGLEGWGATLERRWTGAEGERTSLRDLADALNEAILEAALREADEPVTDPELASTYRALTDDDVSEADRVRTERDLERAGVDVEALRGDFVTHQAVHTYLTDYREVEPPESAAGRVERDVEHLQRLRGRLDAVAESTIAALVDRGDLADHDYQVFVDTRVVCADCGSSYELETLLRRGGCDCEE